MSKLNRVLGIVDSDIIGEVKILPFIVNSENLKEISDDSGHKDLSQEDELNPNSEVCDSGCEFCLHCYDSCDGDCEDCESGDCEDDSIECISVVLETCIVETLEDKFKLTNRVRELVNEFERIDGVSIDVIMEPIKDENGNSKILSGCESVFLNLVRDQKTMFDLKNVLVSKCSIVMKIVD